MEQAGWEGPLAVALTIQEPVIFLAAHLPHEDEPRIDFLKEVAEHKSSKLRALTPKVTPAGAPHGHTPDLPVGRGPEPHKPPHPRHNEKRRPLPTPLVAQAFARL